MIMDCLDAIKISLTSSVTDFSDIINHSVITSSQHESLLLDQGTQAIIRMLIQCREQNGTVYLVGNGGSAAIASHAVIDFMNMATMRAHSLLDSSVTTCISNDYGYEHVYSKQVAQFIQFNDVLIAISSSGKSQNIINAVNAAKKNTAKIITFSGFLENNPLRQLGNYNVWLNTKDYGQVEIGHAFILHYLTDRLRETLFMEIA